ncbi:MAG: zinc-ribbon domain-containing protein [Deltaproteobacteria bacterium]|jgi:hypothetical protein|nr:zinc-ribbon domain-containing protein [Deltaproteobacteria bacterium]
MQIECQYCQKKLNVADDKVTFGKAFSFICPSCKVKNTLTPQAPEPDPFSDPPPPSPEFTAAQTQMPAPAPIPAKPEPPREAVIAGAAPVEISASQFDEMSEGLKAALVAYDSEEIQDMLYQKLSSMGFKPFLALNVRDAVKQLKFGRFQLMLIQEDYYGATLTSNQLLRAVNGLELSIRHEMFIAVIGPSFTSLDDLTAFGLSLDTVINTSDLDDLERILISAMGHVQKFYSTYNEMRLARGLE